MVEHDDGARHEIEQRELFRRELHERLARAHCVGHVHGEDADTRDSVRSGQRLKRDLCVAVLFIGPASPAAAEVVEQLWLPGRVDLVEDLDRAAGEDVAERSTDEPARRARRIGVRGVHGDEDVVGPAHDRRHDRRTLEDVAQPLGVEVGGADDLELGRDLGEGRAVTNRESVKESGHVLLDGLLRQAHPVRDLLVLETLGHELQHHGLLVGDPPAPDAAALSFGRAVLQLRPRRKRWPLCVASETSARLAFNYT